MVLIMKVEKSQHGESAVCFEVDKAMFREQVVAVNALGTMTVNQATNAARSLETAQLGIEIEGLEPLAQSDAEKDNNGNTVPQPVTGNFSKENALVLYQALVQFEADTPSAVSRIGGGRGANERRVEGEMAAVMHDVLRKEFGFEPPKSKPLFGFSRELQEAQTEATPTAKAGLHKTKPNQAEARAITLADAIGEAIDEAGLRKIVPLVDIELLDRYVDNRLISSALYGQKVLAAIKPLLAEDLDVLHDVDLHADALRSAYPHTETALYVQVEHALAVINNLLEPNAGHQIPKLR